MSLYGAFDKTKHLDELDEPLATNEGVLSAATRKARTLANLGVTATAAEINAAADLSGNTVAVAAAGAAVTALTGGGTYLIPAVTANVTITLPAPTLGEKHTFVYVGAVADAEDWVITSPELFIGGVVHLDIPAAVLGIYSDGATHNTLTVNDPAAGTTITFIGNGTDWAVTGQAVGATAPAFTAV